VDDVVAETFLVAWRRLEAVPSDPLPWLYGVARRVAADHRRAARRQDRLSDRLASEWGEADPPLLELPDPELHKALGALSERDRELLLLVHWDDLEPEHRARPRLHACLRRDPAVAGPPAAPRRARTTAR
jgi:RNA polymerase sigma-70 factor (ECF subfamily)